MPQLGETVTEGTILRWLVQVGDEVKEDDPILEPSSESESDCGSYGNLSLPDELNDNPDESDSNPYIY